MATGTNQKMEADTRNQYFGQSFWIPQLMHGEIPLEIDHILLQLLVLCIGLILSTLLFFGEMLFTKCRKCTAGKLLLSLTQVRERKKPIRKVLSKIRVEAWKENQ